MDFQNRTRSEISDILKESGTKSLVFAYDGTRRSHLIQEVLKDSDSNEFSKISINWDDYSNRAFQKMLEISVLMFEHGLKEIIYPMWFPTLGKRGPEYYPKFVKYMWGLKCLLTNKSLADQFESNGIRIIFYGEWREFCRLCGDQELENLLEQLMESSQHRTKHVLLFGTNITSTTEAISTLTIEYYNEFHKLPTKQELIEKYYGLPLSTVDLYIGFDRFVTDGRPPMISEEGSEDLYFTVSPHSYFNEQQLRSILYDHIYSRSVVNSKEYDLTRHDVINMNSFYVANNRSTLGTGNIQNKGKFWYPMPQVTITNTFSPVNLAVSKENMYQKKSTDSKNGGTKGLILSILDKMKNKKKKNTNVQNNNTNTSIETPC